MPRFGIKSHDELNTLDQRLQKLLIIAINYVDFSIIEGHRTIEKQKEYYKNGKTKTMQSKHLDYPSKAVDIAPYPYPDLDSKNKRKRESALMQIYYLAGIIKGIASRENINIRIGCDWNDNNDVRDDDFQDAWHIELI